nr:uncharacterized protein LOC109732728 [Aegilops tauschii subsp. strangulata]
MVDCADDGVQEEQELGSVLIGEMEIFPPIGLDDQRALAGALDLSDGAHEDDSDLSWPATPVGPGRAFGDARQDQAGSTGWLQISLSDEGDVGGQTSFPHPEVDSHAAGSPMQLSGIHADLEGGHVRSNNHTLCANPFANAVAFCNGIQCVVNPLLSAPQMGGVLLAWDPVVVQLSNPHYTNNTVTALVKPVGAAGQWWITGVYGPQSDADKVEFLQELLDIRELHAGPWALVGDFHLIANPEDKSNSAIDRWMMSRFRSKLNLLELKELYLNGMRYTWLNERGQATLERIDHVFVTLDWEALYPTCLLSALGTSVSDHCPLLLDLHADFHVGKRFRFESFWTKAEGFCDVVADAWESVSSEGNPFVVLDRKLRATARKLQSWSDRWIGNVKNQISLVLGIIKQLDVAMEGRDLSPAEIGLRRVLKRCCGFARGTPPQGSSSSMPTIGEKNLIMGLQVDGDLLTGQEKIAGAVDSYYRQILGVAPDREFSLNWDALQLPRLHLEHLEAPFSEEEILTAIKSMPMDKAPGPDGFTTRFYACCWGIIKADLMRVMERFYWGDMRGLHAINKALVTLLPKVDGAEELKDFRPSAFVRGRAIHDNFMMVQGMARKLHSLKQPAVRIKLDILKAFDSVLWPFALEVLRALCFGSRWVSWITGLLYTASTRILVNGVPPIRNKKGFRQGDPLSPMMFILMMEPLQRLLAMADSQGVLSPLVGAPNKRVSIFADDVMLFLKSEAQDLISAMPFWARLWVPRGCG